MMMSTDAAKLIRCQITASQSHGGCMWEVLYSSMVRGHGWQCKEGETGGLDVTCVRC
jgi:hypothetical protein